MKIPFCKTQSIGNDFVLLELNPSYDLADLAIRMGARRFGVGSDGLLTVERTANGVAMRMFNPDGTEDFCGNGLRCAARYVFDEGWVGPEFNLHHGGIVIPTTVVGEAITTVLGVPSDEPSRVPHHHPRPLREEALDVLGETRVVSAITTGSTHTIVETEGPVSDAEVNRIGPALEHHPLFPDRTSVIWAWTVGPGEIAIRIWERGVGETLGCGTGSSAAAEVLGRKYGWSQVGVQNPGGKVQVTRQTDGRLAITGSAQRVFTGFWNAESGGSSIL